MVRPALSFESCAIEPRARVIRDGADLAINPFRMGAEGEHRRLRERY
jgi:hypothetical protein